MPKLPGLNYGAPLGVSDLEHLEGVYTDEFIRRTLAVIASYRTAGGAHGVLAENDPTGASASTDPLFVARNTVDGMRVDVSAGSVITPSGMVAYLNAAVSSVEMVNQAVGQTNVVFLEYAVVEDDDTRVKNRFNVDAAKRNVRTNDTEADPLLPRTLGVASLQDFQDVNLFPPERIADLVPLAYVSITSTTTSPFKQVTVDLSRTTYTTNRPWFSPVDIEHRSQRGTGASTVPHALGLNDLSQGSLTLYSQLVSGGMVVGRDLDAPGVPGSLCLEIVTPARLEVDTTGSVTGAVSQNYVTLTRFPVRLLGAYSLADPDNEIAVELMPHSNILLIHEDDAIPSGGFRLQYSTVQGGEPLSGSLINDEVQFRQPTTNELVISGGQGHTELTPNFTDEFSNQRAQISLGTAAAIPKRYRIFADASGSLLHTPQHLLCATRLDDIGTSVFAFASSMLGVGRLRVGLQDVVLNASTEVTIRLTGTDNQGATVTEDVTFDFSNYETPALGQCVENPKNFQITGTAFVSAISLQVLTRTADGPNTAVCVYAEVNPLQTEALRDACPLAEVFWDGSGICRIQDIRPISVRVEQPTRTPMMKAAGQAALAAHPGNSGLTELISEDLRDPFKLKLLDPARLFKLNDGLRSESLPAGIGIESGGAGLDEDIYTTQALRVLPGSAKRVRVTLLGQDVQRDLLVGNDGILPNVEYRSSATTGPATWTAWTALTAIPDNNGAAYEFGLAADVFKVQLRVKGSVTGLLAHYTRGVQTFIPTTTTQGVDWAADGDAVVIDLASAPGDVTVSLTNPVAGRDYTVKVVQGPVDRDIIWPAAVLFSTTLPLPTISSGDDAVDLFTLHYDGANYLVTYAQDFT